MKSLVMGLYLLSVSVGNQFVSQVNEYIKSSGSELLQGAGYYWFFTGCMVVTSVVYVVWSQFYRGRTYIQAAESVGTEDLADS
jgi:POT family proton-dependent oligopeptide transporter